MKMPALIAALSLLMLQPALALEAGEPAAGQTRYGANCINCHGKTGKGLAEFPALVGLDGVHVAQRLTRYRSKEELGPNSAVMWSIAGELSDADIANIAAYVSATFK